VNLFCLVWAVSLNNMSNIISIYGVIKKSCTHSNHMFCLSKNKLHWNLKTKTVLCDMFLSVHHVQHACIHSFSSCMMQPGKDFLQWPEIVHQTRYYQLFGTGESGSASLNSLWLVKEQQNGMQDSSVNTYCICGKGILAVQLLKDNWRTGATRLQQEVTCMGCCTVTETLCV
jgi:hypothetical protein